MIKSSLIPLTYLRSLLGAALFICCPSLIHAQVPPAPDTTFDNGGTGNNWITPANWDNDVPTGTPSTQTGDNAKIGDNQTALWEQNVNGDPAFGTLTIGQNATLQYRANNNQGLPTGSHVYFQNGATLQYTGGTSNRDDHFFIVPGATANFLTNGNTLYRGSIQGAGNLNAILRGNLEIRKDSGTYTGGTTFTNATGSGARRVWLRRFGSGSQRLGSGVNTVGDKVYLTVDNGNRIPDASTLILNGGSGANNQAKYWLNGGSETISNLTIDSPTTTGAPYLITGNGTNSTGLRVTDTVTFQGTAGAVEIQSRMSGFFPNNVGALARASGVDINADNIVFGGTGNWTINGTKISNPNPPVGSTVTADDYAIGSIGIASGGDVTTNTDVTVNAAFNAASGFTKKGAGTLTLNHTDPDRTIQGGATQDFNVKGIVNIEEGGLVVNNTVKGSVNVGAGGWLGGSGTVEGPTVVTGVHSPGTSPGIQTFANNLSYNGGSSVVRMEVASNGVGVRGTGFDGIDVGNNLAFNATTTLELMFNEAGSAVDWTDLSWDTSKIGTDGWLFYDVSDSTTDFNNLSIQVENWEDSNGLLFDDERAGSSFELFLDGNDIYLNFIAGSVAIPEPSTLMLTGFGALGLLLRRRRN